MYINVHLYLEHNHFVCINMDGTVPIPFLPSHGTLGWDGQWDAGTEGGTVWNVPTLSLVH